MPIWSKSSHYLCCDIVYFSMDLRIISVSWCLNTYDTIIHWRGLVLNNILSIVSNRLYFWDVYLLQLITHCQYIGLKNTIAGFPLCEWSRSWCRCMLRISALPKSFGWFFIVPLAEVMLLPLLFTTCRRKVEWVYIFNIFGLTTWIRPAGRYSLLFVLFLLSYQCQFLWTSE